MPDVRDYEPHVALVGDHMPEIVARAALDVLRPGGHLVLEIGDGQALATAAMLGGLGYVDVVTTPDLTGRVSRIPTACWRPERPPIRACWTACGRSI